MHTQSDRTKFFIPGIPIPQGSKTIVRRGNKAWMIDANTTALHQWRAVVAINADRGITFDCPVTLECTFYLPRPKKPRWLVPAVKPDLDKLLRALSDGLKDGGLVYDDSRIINITAHKEYADDTHPVGVQVTVTPW